MLPSNLGKKSAKLIDGKALADKILLDLRNKIVKLPKPPGLGVVLIGDDPASALYVSSKKKACLKVGINFYDYVCGGQDHANDTEADVVKIIEYLNNNTDVDAIIVQLPMPENFNRQKIIDALAIAKDVDGLHSQNRQDFTQGSRAMTPPLVRAVMEAINSTGENLEQKKVVIVAKSPTFAQPIAEELQHKGLTVTTVAPGKQMAEIVKTADLLISVIGKPGLITADMIKPNAMVIDIGTTLVGEKTWAGDVDPAAANVASWLTPVPGGIGPLTVAMLLRNTYDLAVKKQKSQMASGE